MSSPYSSFIVYVLDANGQVAGTGLLIPDNRIITSVEVLNSILTIEPDSPEELAEAPAEAPVRVILPFIDAKKHFRARIVFWNRGELPPRGNRSSVCVLELVDEIPISVPGQDHYKAVINSFASGRVVPFLGAGTNWRPPEQPFVPGKSLPTGSELTTYLAEKHSYPRGKAHELPRVSQYVTLKEGSVTLYDSLRELFDNDFAPNSLHTFFAGLPSALVNKGLLKTNDSVLRRFLIVTTNYDDVLEKTFLAAQQPCHVVTYFTGDAQSEYRGRFLHYPPGGDSKIVDADPEGYKDLLMDDYPIILKIHGAIDRKQSTKDSFVITEQHYTEYLTRTDIEQLLPEPIPAKLMNSRILFLGYSLRDWNLRVILHRIQSVQQHTYRNWAIQLQVDELEELFWEQHRVDILKEGLKLYIARLKEMLDGM
jgi:hypothetical protein